MKHLFILNPAAGKYNQTMELAEKISAVCKPLGMDYSVQISARKNDCGRIARKAAESGEEYRIYACGGDGTLNEIVCGVAGHDNVAVTNFPCGSGNDFIRIFDDPAAFRDLERLLDPEETRLDLIKIGDSGYALNICSMGFDARIGRDVSKYKRLPAVSGHGAYNLSVVSNLIHGVASEFSIDIDGQTIDGQQTLVCICNGRFYGGGYQPIPEAEPDDGMLDVLIVKPVGRLTVAKVISAYKDGKFRDLPDIITYYRVPQLTVRTPEPSAINADGEIILAGEAPFTVVPKALRYFYPKGLSYRAKTEA